MKNLQNYYGRTLAYVLTELKNGKINSYVSERKAYDPRDFSRRVAPSAGCDLVVGNYSVNSENIFDIGGIMTGNSAFSYGRFDSITLFNHCEISQVEEVKNLHKEAIKNTLREFIESEQNRINETAKILSEL